MTVYYAQNSSVNINSANQWNTAANGSGTFLTWPPASGDALMANGKTSITINVNTTVAEIRTDTANGATAGGGFTLADGITLTASPISGTTDCVTFSANSPAVAYVVGNPIGGGTANRSGIYVSGSGTLNLTGNPTGGSNSGSHGISNAATGIVNVIGNPTGGTGAASGANNQAGGTLNITGNATGGSGSQAYGVQNNGIGTTTINGSSTGGVNATGHGAYNVSTGVLTLNGAAYASPTTLAAGLYGAVAGGYTYAKRAGYASATGAMPYAGFVRFDFTASSLLYVRDNNLTERTYIPAEYSVANGIPAITDVRYGTSYALGALTGTCRVPSSASVVAGVPVDATVGTADLLTAADVRTALGLASANLDTQLDAIPTAAEIWGHTTRELTSSAGGATAQDVWEYATRSLTEAPDVPTVEEIAAEVRTELTPELSRVANCATVESTGDQLAGLL